MNPFRILEIGCGTGRNLAGLLKNGPQVFAIDCDFDAVSTAQSILREDGIADIRFAVADAVTLPFSSGIFNEVHCIDVLHWASSTRQFEAMWMESWRVLKVGGTFFTTLRGDRDDSRWFFADRALIDALVEQCNAEQLDRTGSALSLRKRL